MLINHITLATRNSLLAIRQTNIVKNILLQKYPSITYTVQHIITTGDRNLKQPLYAIGGKALFIKELEIAIKNQKADIAIHSLKDVPYQVTKGFVLDAFLKRSTPQDALVSNYYQSIDELPIGAVIGTSSPRRKAQLLAYRKDLKIKDLRGNVDSRLKKLDQGNYDAIILAAAGLVRLGLEDRISYLIPTEICLPAIGQGIIVVECHEDNKKLRNLVRKINDPISYRCAMAERSFNKFLKGNCHMPIAAYAVITPHNTIHLTAMISSKDGHQILRQETEGIDPEKIGKELAKKIIYMGAYNILS